MAHTRSQAPRAPSRPLRRRATFATLVLVVLLALAVTGFALVAAPASEFTVDVGPVALSAAGGHHANTRPRAIAVPVDGWLRGFWAEVVDDRGKPLPRELLHHVNLIAPEQRELFSPIMLRLGAAGAETAPIKLPAALGYRLHRGDSVMITSMLHNSTAVDYPHVIVRVHFTYTPRGGWLRPLGIYPFYLDVMPPAGIHAYDLPPGHSEQSWEGRPAVAGRIIGVGGHLHEYGAVLRFQDVTTGQMLWEAKPKTDIDGNVTGMPTKYFLPLGIPVRPDHVYRLTAVYDNPTGRMLPGGGMGALGGALIPDDPSAWPRVAQNHPEYRYDLKVTYQGGSEEGHGGHGEHAEGHDAGGHEHGAEHPHQPSHDHTAATPVSTP